MIQRKIVGVLALLVALTLFASVASAHPSMEPTAYPVPNGALDPEGIARLMKDSGGALVEIESATGAARFVRLQGEQIETLAARLGVRKSSAAQADAFFAAYGSVFGIRDAAAELVLVETTTDAIGETHLTYQQVYQGAPVFAGTLRVHLDAQNRVKVVNGAFVPGIGLNVIPSLSAAEAEAVAERTVAGAQLSVGSGVGGVLEAKAVASTLYVYHDGLLKGVTGVSHLVYEVEVSNGYDVREFVYVDAYKGNVVNQITGIQQDLDRQIYSGTLAALLWKEGDAYPWAGEANVTDTVEINALITTTQHTYDFFFNTFGRDSYNDNGIAVHTIFADATLAGYCPNAHWTGSFIGFCRNMAVDDVVAHEMAHAYTQYTHGLIYQWQSGALNEAYSDIWGETVDMLNNFQLDAPDAPRTVGECSLYAGAKRPSLHVTAPAAIAGDYPAGGADFNPAAPVTLTGNVVLVNDGDVTAGSVTDACEALVNGTEVTGSIALIDRGGCEYVVKVMNAQNAGAIGVIVVNNDGDKALTMRDLDANITIPSVFVGQSSGDRLKAALPNLNVTLDFGGAGLDDSIRWLMGEDLVGTPIGVIRDLWTPSCLGNPDKMTDVRGYYCGQGDQGGVHVNVGVPSHAYALLVDGGDYNGRTVNRIGLVKAAHIYWRAQSVYQVPDSDFVDHADALQQACSDLIGENLTGFDGAASGEIIVQADCDAVAAAITAVELRTPSTAVCSFAAVLEPDAPQVCSALDATPFYSETFDTDPGSGWTLSNTGVYTTYTARDWMWAATMPLTMPAPVTRTGGFYAFDYQAFGDCKPTSNDQSGVMYLDSPSLTAPAAAGDEHVLFTFDHYVAVEQGFDGGNVWISVNGADWQWVDPTDFVFNPYNMTLNDAASGNTNPLAGQAGFSGIDAGDLYGSWGQSQVDLSAYVSAGDQFRLRFAFGVDGCNGVDGWYLDQVETYSCVSPAADIVVAPSALANDQAGDMNASLPLTISNASGDKALSWKLLGAGAEWAQVNEDGSGAFSGFFTNYSAGLYHTDDFILDFATTLTSIEVVGYVTGAHLGADTPIDWYIYPDAGGRPAGHPEDGNNAEVWHYASTGGGTGVDIATDNITLDLAAAGQDVQLSGGSYWLIVYPSHPVTATRWNWSDGVDRGAEGLVIAPSGIAGAPLMNWMPQSAVWGWRDLEFSIEGTTECSVPSWLDVSSTGGVVAHNAASELAVAFNSWGMDDGVYTSTVCLAHNDPDAALVRVPVTLTVSTVPLTSAELEGTVQLPYYTDTVITWTVALLPLNAIRPYTYTINSGLPQTTLNNTVVFTRTGDPVGMHQIDFAVWNPVMSEPLTRTWPYEIVARPGYTVYLPLVLRSTTP